MSTVQRRRLIDRVAAPEFLARLDEVPLTGLLDRIGICADLDLEYSYYRRLVQGRLDIVGFEMARRRGDDDRDLRAALPDILARAGTPDGDVRFRRRHLVGLLEDALPGEVHALITTVFPLDPPPRAPEWVPAAGHREIDRVLTDDIVPRLDEAGDDQLATAHAELASLEHDMSAERRRILGAADDLERAAIRRLKAPLDRAAVVHTVEWVCDAYVRRLARAIPTAGS